MDSSPFTKIPSPLSMPPNGELAVVQTAFLRMQPSEGAEQQEEEDTSGEQFDTFSARSSGEAPLS